jgi:DUF4097 and DUF4098 domain-containing protein YvlB
MFTLPLLAASLLFAQSPSAFDTDTTVAVQPGTRLRVQNQGGDIVVKAWDRNQLRIQATHSRRNELSISVHGAVAEIESHGRHGISSLVDYELTVPTWMALDLGGMYAEVTIEGTRAAIKVQTLEGNITVKGGAETVALNTVNGKIMVSQARGRLDLHSVSEGIRVTDAEGDVTAETVSGDIELRNVDAKSVDVQTVSGDLTYSGRISDRGTYSLLTHSGEITVGIPEGSNATIAVATASGDVSSSMGLTAERQGRRRQTFRLGNGSASFDLETFSGDVQIVRPSEIRSRHGDRDDDNLRPRVKVKRNRPNSNDDHDQEEDDQ